MVDEEARATTPDKCVGCGAPIEQLDGGHRRRRYCNNNNACKQKAHRKSKIEQHKEQVRERWTGFAPGTQDYLEWLMVRSEYGPAFAEGLASIIKYEQQVVTPEPVLSLEQALQRAEWNNYTNETIYLGSTGRLFVSLLQTAGAETARQVAEVINHERNYKWQAMQPYVAELKQTIETQQAHITTLEQELVSEKTASSVGEKMLERQHRELGAQLLKVGRSLSYPNLPLSHFYGDLDHDLGDIKAGKSNWEEASYSLSPTGLLIALVFAKHVVLTEQVLKQERDIISDQAWREKLQQERVVGDTQVLKERLRCAEQELDRYREVADLSNRERLEQQFMVTGQQIAYKFLLIGVGEGVDEWMAYIRDASDEQLVKAIAAARYYAENIIGLEQGEQLRKANKRIAELERAVPQQRVLKTVS